jgi:hypothetical protein
MYERDKGKNERKLGAKIRKNSFLFLSFIGPFTPFIVRHISILSQTNSFQTLQPSFPKIHFNRRDGKKVIPTKFSFPTKCNCNNNEIYTDNSYIFCDYKTIFPQRLHHFQRMSANAEHDTVNQCGKFPASTSEHITSGTRKLRSNCDNATVEFVLTET